MSKEKQSSFKAVLQQANRIKSGETLNEQPPEYANMTIRVLKENRAHWQASAKREGITITDIIVECLTERYGTSDS
ncbi:MAG: hypothetical protein CMD81_08120 [Gammaproteobacteria bacterium]|nr:hypothetical protein [Gammaproteobacteria bacterium]MBK82306.1 hypothetical protein [Gammaproteobacteria bacterium]MBK83782.1 hypothetical protein [Gammaproteobacteria bacterium]HCV03277.1 hypothetical protein [Pseudoalteromonas sp.]|tara:strand:- start:760 stop:987 length:228 start_codon:yes stop_codon:yes gene_type:complete